MPYVAAYAKWVAAAHRAYRQRDRAGLIHLGKHGPYGAALIAAQIRPLDLFRNGETDPAPDLAQLLRAAELSGVAPELRRPPPVLRPRIRVRRLTAHLRQHAPPHAPSVAA